VTAGRNTDADERSPDQTTVDRRAYLFALAPALVVLAVTPALAVLAPVLAPDLGLVRFAGLPGPVNRPRRPTSRRAS
jgi:hypothetical protein